MDIVCPNCQRRFRTVEGADASAATCPACGLMIVLTAPAAVKPARVDASVLADAHAEPDENEANLRAELPEDYPAEAAKLGRPRYRVEPIGLPDKAYHPVFAAVLCCIPAIFCLINPGAILLFLIGLLWIGGMIGFSVWFVRWQSRKSKAHAIVHEHGFVQFDGSGFTVWRWSDVASVNMQNIDYRSYVYFIQVQQFQTKSYRLRSVEGAQYAFWSTQGPRAEQFGLLVERETFARMMPAALARLQAGKSVTFEPFIIDPDGIGFADRSLAWSKVGRVRFEDGKLLVGKLGPNGDPAKVLLDKIDNSHVFLALLEQNLGQRSER